MLLVTAKKRIRFLGDMPLDALIRTASPIRFVVSWYGGLVREKLPAERFLRRDYFNVQTSEFRVIIDSDVPGCLVEGSISLFSVSLSPCPSISLPLSSAPQT